MATRMAASSPLFVYTLHKKVWPSNLSKFTGPCRGKSEVFPETGMHLDETREALH